MARLYVFNYRETPLSPAFLFTINLHLPYLFHLLSLCNAQQCSCAVTVLLSVGTPVPQLTPQGASFVSLPALSTPDPVQALFDLPLLPSAFT